MDVIDLSQIWGFIEEKLVQIRRHIHFIPKGLDVHGKYTSLDLECLEYSIFKMAFTWDVYVGDFQNFPNLCLKYFPSKFG